MGQGPTINWKAGIFMTITLCILLYKKSYTELISWEVDLHGGVDLVKVDLLGGHVLLSSVQL